MAKHMAVCWHIPILCFSSMKVDVPQQWCSRQPPLSTKGASIYCHSSLCSRAHHWIRTTRDPVPGLQLGLLWMFQHQRWCHSCFFFFFPVLKTTFIEYLFCVKLCAKCCKWVNSFSLCKIWGNATAVFHFTDKELRLREVSSLVQGHTATNG